MEEEKNARIVARLKIEEQHRSGAQWFYWIAGLSLVNSVVLLTGGEWSFVVGLGVTQIIDAIGLELAKEIGFTGKIIAFIGDIIVSGVFVFFGIFANKKKTWAFLVGMILYGLDGLLFFLVRDYLSIGFHIFALYCIFSGYKAKSMVDQMDHDLQEEQNASAGTFH